MILQFYMETVTHKLSRLREEANLAWLPHAPRPSQAGSEAHTTLRSGIREYENPHIFCCQSSLGFYLHAFLQQYHLSSIVPQDKVSAPKTAEGWVPPGPPNPLTATSKLPRTYSWVFFRVCPAEKYSGIKLYAQLFFFFKQTKPPSLTGKGRDGIRQTSYTDGSPFCLSACKCFLFWNYTVLTEPETAI